MKPREISSLKRFQARASRPINQEVFIDEWPEAGLTIIDSPLDPSPSVTVIDGRVTEMDGRSETEFDLIDRFIADYSIDPGVATKAMATHSVELARMVADFNVPRAEVARLVRGCTPAKLVDVIRQLNIVEMMSGLQKMHVRRTPANQAHVTNRKDSPVLLACDAAEAALRGFAEEETTVGLARYAPLNALAVLVGSQTGRGGVLTQCSVEESMGLRIALKGFTSYAETLSVYGTAGAFVDGDDTPWSKAFLASSYASRGVKVRFTSGTGSEALMAHSEGKSMLYLEARCLLMVKGAGSQGVQNGSISLIAMPMSLPGGLWGVLAENLLASMLGLELASGNDALSSHSQLRKGAKLMLQFLPGTDFVTSGYSSMPKADNMFGGGNFDSDDYDDWYALQRDMLTNGGIHSVNEADVISVRQKAANAIRAVFDELGLPEISENEASCAVYAYDSLDVPNRDQTRDMKAVDGVMSGDLGVADVIRALAKTGFRDVAERILEMERQRLIGDYLQPAAIFNSKFFVQSALNDANDYQGPGTGYRLRQEPEWEQVKYLPNAQDPRSMNETRVEAALFSELGPAESGTGPEVVIGVGPALGSRLRRTISGLDHSDVIAAIVKGIRAEGVSCRIIKVYDTSDCAFIGHMAARLSGSGIGIGLQSKGTAVIHRNDLAPLTNLELFSMAPSLTLESYQAIGRNAACYATGRAVPPVPVVVDNTARLRLIVQTTVLHLIETREVCPTRPPELVELRR
jgi:propanediol dehydratase large subunit